MRKANAIVVSLMIVALLAHMILGGLELAGIGGMPMRWLSDSLLLIVGVHIVLSTILTVKSIIAIKKSGTHYFKENKLFWLRRFSGLLIIVGLVFHLIIFYSKDNEAYRLEAFNFVYLASQIILILFIAIHVISNIKPVLISFGITSLKRFSVDILFILSIALLLSLVAFIIYYVRWQV